MNLANKEIQTVPSISAWPSSKRKTGFYYDDRMLKHREILNTTAVNDGDHTLAASTSHNEHPDRIQKPFFGEWIYDYLVSVWSRCCCGCKRWIGVAIIRWMRSHSLPKLICFSLLPLRIVQTWIS